MCKRTTSEYIGDTLSNALKMLASRSIKTVGVNRWSCIVGRTSERHIICQPNQIVNIDDIPSDCEVIYMGFDFDSDTPREISYQDPVFCDIFYALVYEKRKRRENGLRTIYSRR